MPDANLEMAVKAAVFGAIGTAGQRCTSTRRLLLHEDIAAPFLDKLLAAYAQIVPKRIGDPLEVGTLVSPLHSSDALTSFHETIAAAKAQGGQVLFGGRQHEPRSMTLAGGVWAEPTVIRFETGAKPAVMQEECFAPVLFVQTFKSLAEAVQINNSGALARLVAMLTYAVRQGLSSSIFTRDVGNIHQWTGPGGSDWCVCRLVSPCSSGSGIVNVNTSTSGAEIGCGFGGNKATGWGRESGGDAWKVRPQTVRLSKCRAAVLPLVVDLHQLFGRRAAGSGHRVSQTAEQR